MLDRGWLLVADDQVCLNPPGTPPALAGKLEVRGLGILTGLPCAAPPLSFRLAVELMPSPAEVPRLPVPRRWRAAGLDLPCLSLFAFEASAPAKVAWALEVVLGRRALAVGAFAA